jgi:hypothetical protein
MADKREKSIDVRSKEVIEKLFRSKDILQNPQIIEYFKKNLNEDEIVEKAYDYYTKRYNKLSKRARQFKEALYSKYPSLTTVKLIKKARQYAKKYELSDAEFTLFINLLKTDNTHQFNDNIKLNSTPMGKTLGFKPEYNYTKLNYDVAKDTSDLNQILELNRTSNFLSKRVKIQSLTYNDCDAIALTGKFDQTKHNIYQHVHPVIAALFIPKISVLEERMILANISELIAKKNEGRIIQDLPTYQLYNDLITDPNQSLDNMIRPMQDLNIRTLIQVKLWQAIDAIRSGRYYDFDSAEFDNILSKYPSSVYDAPDLLYSKDAGNVLRRILNAFSLRPTRVSVSRIIAPIQSAITSMFDLTNNFNTISHEKEHIATDIPMINVRIPPKSSDNSVSVPIRISADIAPSQWFAHKNNPVLYKQKIINSNGVLFFYINRQYSSINSAQYNNKQYTFNQLPPTIVGASRLNDRNVDFENAITINDQVFVLRSVVCSDTIKINEFDIISGTSAIIISKYDVSMTEPTHYFNYAPQNAGMKNNGLDTGPVTLLHSFLDNSYPEQTFEGIARTHGTIFMYVNPSTQM